MINVKNKKTIKRVADTSFKKEKMRNIFAMIAITLTTVLFCSLFAVSSSFLASMEESTMRQVGGSSHGGFKNVTIEQYETLRKHPDIKEISYTVALATAENAKLSKRPTEIRYANDELAAEMRFSLPTTGRLPEAKNEIATDTLVLERLGIPAKLGENVTLEYSVCDTEYTESFTLVGFWEGDIIMSASQVWLSRDYVEEVLSRHNIISNAEQVIGSIQADFNFDNSWNLEHKILKVIIESGYSPDNINYGVNWAYVGGSSIEFGTIMGLFMIVLIVIFCGYLMISNVFLISVTKDVHFYGLLKTVGTTGKQIKVLIRRQAMRISLMGIPIGLLMGSLVGSMITPFVLGILNTNVIKISIRWWVFLFAAGFALITVFISIHKAEKMASKVSPIEALRITDATVSKKKKFGQKISLWKMAGENLLRNRKKLVLVTLSLSLSLVILNGAYSLANSFDMDKYVSTMISHDFVVSDVSWFNVYLRYTDADTLDDDFLNKLSKHDGIESLEKVYFSENYCEIDEHWDDMEKRANAELGMTGEWLEHLKKGIADGFLQYHVYGIDDAVWDDLTVWQGEIALEKLHSGDYVVVSPYDEEGKLCVYEIGDKIEVINKGGQSRTCEIMAIASVPYNISIQHTHPVEVNILVPSEVFLRNVEQKCPMLVTLDVEEDKIDTIEHFLKEYCQGQNPNMQYASRATYAAEYEGIQKTYKVVGTVVSVLLSLIGIANFANTSITSIVARKREFALLECIGMTVKQQRTMLILEGLIYMLLTAVFTCIISILIGYFGLSLVLGSGFYTLKFTMMPSMICMPCFMMIAVLIPVLSQKYVNNESVVERLRMAE